MKMLTLQIKMKMITMMVWGLGTIDRQLKVVGRNANMLARQIGIVDFSHMLKTGRYKFQLNRVV